MKKTKILAVVSSAFLATALCGVMTSCGEKSETKTGEYAYVNPYDSSSSYGVKVSVDVKGDVIQSVSIVDSNYIEVSESNADWGWDNSAWTDGKADFLKVFEGMTVSDLEAVTVTTEAGGAPSAVSGMGVVTGATQSSGRLILAVKNALGIDSTVTYTGEYKYTIPAWYTTYGVKVSVDVYAGKIESVTLVDSDYVEVTDSWSDKAVWENGRDAFIASFEGMNVVDLAKVEVEVGVSGNGAGEMGEPLSVSGMDIVTGATMCSGRLILAVQNALGVQNRTAISTATAYGLVHTGAYVGAATVTTTGDKLTDLTLKEYVFLDYSTYAKVNDGEFYEKVSYGTKELTYNGTNYVDEDGVTFAELMADEDNCKEYVEAIEAGEIYVELADGSLDNTKITAAQLDKEFNGYWTVPVGLQWIPNRDATVKYVLENGVDNLLALEKGEDGYWYDGDVSTGATWTDLNSDPEGYLSYAQLILNAYDAALDY